MSPGSAGSTRAIEKIDATAPIGLAWLSADRRYPQINQRLTEMHKAFQTPRNFCLTGLFGDSGVRHSEECVGPPMVPVLIL